MTWTVSTPGTAAAGATLCDAGAVANANGVSLNPEVIVSANVTGVVTLQHRDTTNVNTLKEWNFAINGGGTVSYKFTDSISLAQNERLRLVARTSFNTAGNIVQGMLGGV